MSKMEPSIYMIGAEKHWRVRLRHLKTVLVSLGILLLVMLAIIIFQHFWGQKLLEKVQGQLKQEQLKNKKLHAFLGSSQSLSQKIAQDSVPAAVSIPATDNSSSLLWEQQQKELTDLKAKFKVSIQQKQKLSQNLKETTKALKQQQQESSRTIFSLKTQKQNFLTQILSLEKKNAELSQTKGSRKTSVQKSSQSIASGTPAPVTITDFKILKNSSKRTAQFTIQNTTDVQQRGKIGVFLISPSAQNPKPESDKSSVKPFSIKFYKTVTWPYPEHGTPNMELRVLIWDQEGVLIQEKRF